MTYVPTEHLFHSGVCGWWQLRQEGVLYLVGQAETQGTARGAFAYVYHSILEHVDIASRRSD
jgi:hypothetical protein